MNKILVTLGIALVAILAIGSVYAFQNNANVDRVAAQQAVQAGDYATWKSLHANSNEKMASLINENNFHLLKEMQDAKETKNFARVKEIKAELGFTGPSYGKGMGMHKGQKQGRNAANCPYAA